MIFILFNYIYNNYYNKYNNSKKIDKLEEIVIIEKDNYCYNNIYEIV
jgi:hypothetical protein